MDNIFDQHASADIIFYLDDFEGPIELLVHLCRVSGLDVHTVQISSITDQYFKYIQNIESSAMDMDKVSDFLVMAATLLEIKARAALPKEEEDEEVEEEVDAEEELRRRMIEAAMFQKKAEEIKQQETLHRFYREPQYTDADARITLKNFNLDKLMQAYAYLFYRFNHTDGEEEDVKHIVKDTFTVKEKLNSLVEALMRDKEIKFFDLFDEYYDKSEVITTFMALLELVNKQFAVINQAEQSLEIIIALNSDCNPETYDFSQLDISIDNVITEEDING